MLNKTDKGLGLRPEFIHALLEIQNSGVDFVEIAPENWIKVGGKRQMLLQQYTEVFPVVLHGLCLSIGGPMPIDISFVQEIKQFMDRYHIDVYSEHLSYCNDAQGYLYDLLPIPFTKEAVDYVSQRIKQVQDILERPLILENASYYAAPEQQMSEIEFINAIVTETKCQILLDVNNVYVNSINHNYDAKHFLDQLPSSHIHYIHIAGHKRQSHDLIIDTHGDKVIDDVWQLLQYTYQRHGLFPTLLERDFNIPPLTALFDELQEISRIQQTVKISEYA
ncbi:HvfB family MNIO-type RiPP peptide maturase [Facilibium subflavum]|uniref:HvfB family MNIO-type RiPP peptide maturase n=1 Tax=Facilibium subflavum TaxID=2219058 RepID=UPI001F295D1B|nr:DUF692 domain-containing protein [Facilibium subflavum]